MNCKGAVFGYLEGILMLMTLLISCSRSPGQLERADLVMESDPESAMAELRGVDREDLSPDDSAYFALLYTQAMIRCGIVVSSDSLICTAYRTYGRGEAGLLLQCKERI